MGTWSALVEPNWLDIHLEEVAIPDLPPAWEGQVVAVTGDFQVGMWLANWRTMRRAIAALVAIRPAAVLLTGDFLYLAEVNLKHQIEQTVGLLRPLISAGIPSYTVLGNHDYGIKWPGDPPRVKDVEALVAALTAAGLRVLDNEVVALPDPDPLIGQADARPAHRPGPAAGPLYLAGIGSSWANNDRVEETMAAIPARAPRLVLMHNVYSFLRCPPYSAPLTVAGHTHGGQIRLPGMRWDWLRVLGEAPIRGFGWEAPELGQPGNRAYINRGLGFSLVPLRLNARPEVTLFTLRRVQAFRSP